MRFFWALVRDTGLEVEPMVDEDGSAETDSAESDGSEAVVSEATVSVEVVSAVTDGEEGIFEADVDDLSLHPTAKRMRTAPPSTGRPFARNVIEQTKTGTKQ